MSDRADWLAWRAQGITATDVARAWTGRYGGAYCVVAEKLGLVEGPAETDRMRRGSDLEPVLSGMVQLATGWTVVGEQTWCEHPEHPERRATVDGFVVEDPAADLADAVAIIEEKTVGTDVRPAWDYYRAQIQWQLHVTGFDRAILAIATVDDDTARIVRFTWTLVEADELAQLALVASADELGRHLADGTTPAPDGSPYATDAVRAATFTETPSADTVDLSDLEPLLDRRQELVPLVKAAHDELGEIDNRLRDRIGVAGHGRSDRFTVTVSKPRAVFNAERALAAHPEYATAAFDRAAAEAALGKKALDAYREPKGARVLTVKPHKEPS